MLRFTDDLRDRHGIPVTSAMHTDVPGAVVGFVDALAASGVRYLSAAHNWAGRSVPFLHRRPGAGPRRSGGGRRPATGCWSGSPTARTAWPTWRATSSAWRRASPPPSTCCPATCTRWPTSRCPYGSEAFGWSVLDVEGLTKRAVPARPAAPARAGRQRRQRRPVDRAAVDRAGVERGVRVPAAADGHQHRVLRRGASSASATGSQEHEGDWTDWWADGLGSGARPLGYARRAQHAVARTPRRCTRSPAPADEAARAVDGGLRQARPVRRAHLGRGQPVARPRGRLRLRRHAVGPQVRAWPTPPPTTPRTCGGPARTGSAPGSPRRTARSPRTWSPTSVRPTAPTWRRVFLPASTVPLETAGVHRGRPHRRDGAAPRGRSSTRRTGRPGRGGRWLQLRGRRRAGDGPRAVRRRRAGEAGAGAAIDLGPTWQIAERVLPGRRRPGATASIASIFDKRAGRELVNARRVRAASNQYVYDRYSTAPHINHLSGHIEATDEHLALLGGRSIGRRASIVRAAADRRRRDAGDRARRRGHDWLRTTITLHRRRAAGRHHQPAATRRARRRRRASSSRSRSRAGDPGRRGS